MDDQLHETGAVYRETADAIERLAPGDCHPALFTRRCAVAAALRAMAGDPQDGSNLRVLAAVRFLAYRLRHEKVSNLAG